jgi:glycosyl transferase family 25
MKMVGIKGTVNWLVPEWAQGLQRLGDQFEIRTLDQVPADEDCYIHIGYVSNKRNIYSQENYDGITFVHRSGLPYLVFEFSPFRQVADRYWKVGWTHYNYAQGNFNATPYDDARWKKFSQDTGIVIKDWHSPGDNILIIGQLEYDSALNHMYDQGYDSFYDWVFDCVDRIRMHTDRPIVIRPHPRNFVERCQNPNVPFSMEDVIARCQSYKDVTVSENLTFVNYYRTKNGGDGLIKDLQSSHCVVTYSSSAAVEAVCMGIPVFSFDPGAPCHDISHHDISDIENLDYTINTTKWRNSIACSAWSVDEIKDGTCWNHLKPVHFPDSNIVPINHSSSKHKILIINLQHHKDRRDYMIEEMSRAGINNYEFVAAIDGKKLSQSVLDEVYDQSGTKERYHRDLACTEIGCMMSHYDCYQMILDQDLDFGVIFEDDIMVCPNFSLDQLQIPAGQDIMLVGGRIREISEKHDHGIKILKHKADGAYAYVVSRDGARKLLEHYDKVRRVVDDWGSLIDNGIKICYLPRMIINVNRNIESYIAQDRDQVRKIASQNRMASVRSAKKVIAPAIKRSKKPNTKIKIPALSVHVFVDRQADVKNLCSIRDSMLKIFAITTHITAWITTEIKLTDLSNLADLLIESAVSSTDAYFKALKESQSKYLFMINGGSQFHGIHHKIDKILQIMKSERLLHLRFESNRDIRHTDWIEPRSRDGFDYCLTSSMIDSAPHIINRKYYLSDVLPFLQINPITGAIDYSNVSFVESAIYGAANPNPTAAKHDDGC